MSALLPNNVMNLFKAMINKLLSNPLKLKRIIKYFIGMLGFIFWYKKVRCRPHDNIHLMPDWNPISGHQHIGMVYFKDITKIHYEMAKRAGWPKIVAMSSWRHLYGTFRLDPELVKYVFDTKFKSFQKGDRIKGELEELLGDGIFTSDPPEWKFHRKVAARMFSMRNLKNYMFECTVSHTKKVIDKINSDEAIMNDVDIYEMLGRFTLDCFTSIAFGKSIESVSLYPKPNQFATSFDRLMECFAFRHVTPPFIWKALRFLPFEIGNEGQIKRDIRVINEFSDRVLDSRQEKISNISDESGDKYNDIISLFSKHDNTLTRTQLKYIAMNMIIAGRDTTRLIISWCLYELCKRPQIKQKIYEEIDEFVKQNGSKEIGYDQIGKSLKYLECTLLESLRMNPVVPWLIRRCMEDVELPNGNIIREGNEVVVPTYTYARNPNIYEDPLKFDPNRFYQKGKEPVYVFDVYKYPFFNINPRLCLGRTLALMESKVFLFYFCQQYDFEMSDPNQQIKIKTGVVLNMVDGLRLKVTKR